MVSRTRMEHELLGALRDLAKTALPLGRLLTELNVLLREPMGYDASCWHGTAPATGFVTSTVAENLDPRGFERAADLEMWTPEPLTFTRLRVSGRKAATLVQAAGGRPEDSTRFRELLEPVGFGDELRINFDLPSGCWGSAVFMRSSDRGPFTSREVGLAERLAPHISQLPPVSRLPERPVRRRSAAPSGRRRAGAHPPGQVADAACHAAGGLSLGAGRHRRRARHAVGASPRGLDEHGAQHSRAGRRGARPPGT
ncbi:hypothetical protein [Myxococcus landrumensis]|uniref:GAF domain-containing protein n=1 Tax=Myxococcus landrumensis TaxID=2813577 RepID=A0ABX7NJ69_9BACT|nr:hypothetical protein [Myxococcus landrumus]QSQ17524.1 hypothetical protein JY572_16420 [Myxococcus landrumus]